MYIPLGVRESETFFASNLLVDISAGLTGSAPGFRSFMSVETCLFLGKRSFF